MSILDNLENSWDDNFEFEHKNIQVKDNMGREIFWEDIGRPNE